MSGFGVFMTVLFVLGLIYLVAGAVYNHQVYGAKGMDLLPNLGMFNNRSPELDLEEQCADQWFPLYILDFWKDVPGLIVDLARQLWNSVTGRRSASHGGYETV